MMTVTETVRDTGYVHTTRLGLSRLGSWSGRDANACAILIAGPIFSTLLHAAAVLLQSAWTMRNFERKRSRARRSSPFRP